MPVGLAPAAPCPRAGRFAPLVLSPRWNLVMLSPVPPQCPEPAPAVLGTGTHLSEPPSAPLTLILLLLILPVLLLRRICSGLQETLQRSSTWLWSRPLLPHPHSTAARAPVPGAPLSPLRVEGLGSRRHLWHLLGQPAGHSLGAHLLPGTLLHLPVQQTPMAVPRQPPSHSAGRGDSGGQGAVPTSGSPTCSTIGPYLTAAHSRIVISATNIATES